MTEQAQVVVVGGGVLGCAIAWRLAVEGREVLLLERNELGSGASSRAAGLIVPLRASAEAMWFVEQTLCAFVDLPDCGFRRVGTLHVTASQRGDSQVQAMMALAEFECRALDLSELQQRVPWLDAAAATQALFVPSGGFADPYLVTMVYADAARKGGAVLRPRTGVREIVVVGGEVIGVRTDETLIRARTVVLAAGAWSAPLLSPLQIPLPMAPVRSDYWMTEPAPIFAPTQPVVLLPEAHAYTRPDRDRIVLGVRASESPSWDARSLPADVGSLDLASVEEQWSGLIERGPELRRFVPGLDRLGMAHYIAGLSTYTPDGKFVVGAISAVRGLVVASGCNGSGIAASAGIARLVADLVQERRPAIDMRPFRPERFGGVDAYSAAFRARCSAARGSKAGVDVAVR